MRYLRSGIFLAIGIFGISLTTLAQRDTLSRQTINITSSFKPVLKDAVKINFNAAPPTPDSSRPRLTYSIPTGELFTTYRPLALQPLALAIDSTGKWGASNFVKVGFGNYQTPFFQAGFTLGNATIPISTCLHIMFLPRVARSATKISRMRDSLPMEALLRQKN